MRVWLIKLGEPLPTDGDDARLFRTGMLARKLSQRGHDVTWWAATFRHFQKTHRFADDKVVELSERYRLRLIHTPGYRRNLSVARAWDHALWARKFTQQASVLPAPSVILCSMPLPGLCLAATKYGDKHGVPVILDIRDLWPDVLYEAMPRGLAWLALPALWPMTRTTRTACSMAAAIFATNPSYLQWGLDHASRAAASFDRAFPIGYSSETPSPQAVEAANHFWDSHDVGRDPGEFVTCFFGQLGRHFEIEPILRAARRLQGGRRKFRFVFCGSGSNLERYRRMAADLENVAFPGFVDFAAIWTLMRRSRSGLAPYRSTGNFKRALPNKPIEYMSGGLPILSSLRGTLEELLRERDCGLTYGNGDVEEIIELLVRLHDDEALRSRMAANSRALFEEKFVADSIYADMVRHIERIVEGGALA